MDYRERKYYLLQLHCKYYNEELQILKKYVPSLKCHSPYNHYTNHPYQLKKLRLATVIINGIRCVPEYDGYCADHYVQLMVSCRLSDVDQLMKFLNQYGNPEFRFCIEVTKEDLGQ